MSTHLEQKYAIIVATLPRVLPGQLIETMRVALGYADRASVNKLVKALRAAGYNMSAWDETAKRSHTDSPAVKQSIARALEAKKASAKAKAAERGLSVSQASRIASRAIVERAPIAPRMLVRDHLEQWLSDMRSVASDRSPLDRLMVLWGVDRRKVYDRIASIRETGVDMSWWTPAPSRGFRKQACRPQPVTIPRLMAPVESPAYRPAVPWTLQGLALVTDMPLDKVFERAERMGIEAYANTMVDARTARLIMWTLGFTPLSAPQAAQ